MPASFLKHNFPSTGLALFVRNKLIELVYIIETLIFLSDIPASNFALISGSRSAGENNGTTNAPDET